MSIQQAGTDKIRFILFVGAGTTKKFVHSKHQKGNCKQFKVLGWNHRFIAAH